MAQIDELRLMTKVARMYYEQEMRQSEIAKQLDLSQATISRLFKRARKEGIVRITVNIPQGVYTELEEALTEKFNLKDAIVVDTPREDDEEVVMRDLGAAAAFYVESIIKKDEIIGISSWSSSLLKMVDAMQQLPRKSNIKVVQILGGIGNPDAEKHAYRLTDRFARLVNGTAIFLPVPSILGSEASLQVLLDDPYVREAVDTFNDVTMALVGIGAVEPSNLLAESGNIYSEEEKAILRANGAVGDILLHFYDANGVRVQTFLDDRVASMKLEQIHQVEHAIGVAGGLRKHDAILGALRGQWLNVLITDRFTAEKLVQFSESTQDPQSIESTAKA